jgi:hypothetical protein
VDFEGTTQPAGEAVAAWLEEYFLKSEARVAAPGHIRGGDGELCGVLGFEFTSNSSLKSESGEEPCRAWGAAWRASAGGALPPVFLQHNTHSRTVIGMMRRTNGSRNVLMLDPAKKFSSKDLDKPDWQVCHFSAKRYRPMFSLNRLYRCFPRSEAIPLCFGKDTSSAQPVPARARTPGACTGIGSAVGSQQNPSRECLQAVNMAFVKSYSGSENILKDSCNPFKTCGSGLSFTRQKKTFDISREFNSSGGVSGIFRHKNLDVPFPVLEGWRVVEPVVRALLKTHNK